MQCVKWLVICVFFWTVVQGAPFINDKYQTKALDFMKKYGYIEEDDGTSEALYSEQGISDIIKTVQKFGGIEETGLIDNATLKLMSSPRCGVPDIIHSTNKRHKRFVLGSRGWNKRHITYYIANWSPKLGEQIVHKNIQLALDTWGKYGNLHFERSYSRSADIIVSFGTGYHGDNFPFDGTGNVLAHAFFPSGFGGGIDGDIHFDDDENWTDNPNQNYGTDFFTVALHELGHSLGLAHSTVPTAIMGPYYRGYDENNKYNLDYDDILGIYELYIRRRLPGDGTTTTTTTTTRKPTTTTTRRTTRWTTTKKPTTKKLITRRTTTTRRPATIVPTVHKPTLTPNITYHGDSESVDDHKNHEGRGNSSEIIPNICSGYFDAVANLRNEMFIFKDDFVWRLHERGRIMKGYPVKIHHMFPKLPKYVTQIDAAYERPDGMIILFTGSVFWVYNGADFVENSPVPLSHYGLPDSLNGIDAIQIWGRNKKTYIYKNDQFWRYNEETKLMDEGYPQHMEKWRRIPEELDSAMTWTDGLTYFFKGELFWSFDNDFVIATDESPLPTPQVWLGCDENDRMREIVRNFYH